ncbi:helix-turn-helix domain-containing protein [Larkinella arboricola]
MASYKQSDYEALRRRCVELHQAGWKQMAIAQAFGLTQSWVSQTLNRIAEAVDPRRVGVGLLERQVEE